MSISPFSTRPASPEGESRRTRLALLAAAVGIAATLLAYAVSPGVRHAVGHATHSVKHVVSRVFDRDAGKRAHRKLPAHKVRPAAPRNTSTGSRSSPGFTSTSRVPTTAR